MNQKEKIGLFAILVAILVVGILIWLKSPSDSGLTETIQTENTKVVDAVKEVGKKVDGTNNQLETVKSTLGDISSYTSNIADNAGNIANNTYYCSLESRRVEKARQDSVAKQEKIKKLQKSIEDQQKQLKEVKTGKPAVTEKQNQADSTNLVVQIGKMMDTKLDARFAPVNKALDSLRGGQKGIETRMTGLETRMTKIETDVNKLTGGDLNARLSMGERGYVKMKKKKEKDCERSLNAVE